LKLAVVEKSVVVRVDAETNLDPAGRATKVTGENRQRFDEHVVRYAVAYISDARDFFPLELVVSVVVDTAQDRLPAVRAVLARRLADGHRERVLAGGSVAAVFPVVGAGDEQAQTRHQSECCTHLRGLHLPKLLTYVASTRSHDADHHQTQNQFGGRAPAERSDRAHENTPISGGFEPTSVRD
jgi:hypothetical protein